MKHSGTERSGGARYSWRWMRVWWRVFVCMRRWVVVIKSSLMLSLLLLMIIISCGRECANCFLTNPRFEIKIVIWIGSQSNYSTLNLIVHHLPNIRMIAFLDCDCFDSPCIDPCWTPVKCTNFEINWLCLERCNVDVTTTWEWHCREKITQNGCMLRTESNLNSHSGVQHNHDDHWNGEEYQRRQFPQRESWRIIQHCTKCWVFYCWIVCWKW